jgi:hypothetical protein
MVHEIILPIQPDPQRPGWAAEDYALSLVASLNAQMTAVVPSFAEMFVARLSTR